MNPSPLTAPEKSGAIFLNIYDIYFNMRILPYLVLLSAIAIAGCAAFFSIVGLKLLFVGGGISIVIMGAALEIGKLITASFLKQKWDEIGLMLKVYMLTATLVLIGITSVGIYGYLTAGFNATAITVQGYERTIDQNTKRISELEKEISVLKDDKYNDSEIASVDVNRKAYIDQRLQLINQKNQQIEKIRASASTDNSSATDILSAKQALELSKQALDSDTARELEQIKLYNSRLEILDKEVQRWIDEGDNGGLFKKSGLDKARLVKEGQAKERGDIDSQIKASQDRISKLRDQYALQVKEYNDRIAAIESRGKSQKSTVEDNVKSVQKEISDIMASIEKYNKDMDGKIVELNNQKDKSILENKNKIEENNKTIKVLHTEIDAAREKIVHTDVGTFKFIAKSLNIELNDAVNYFVCVIMFVFDPLAVCLILAYNSMIRSKKDEEVEPKIGEIKKKELLTEKPVYTEPKKVYEPSPSTHQQPTNEPTVEIESPIQQKQEQSYNPKEQKVVVEEESISYSIGKVIKETPQPTSTPLPTELPLPSETPSPTSTPIPTEEPQQTPSPTVVETENVEEVQKDDPSLSFVKPMPPPQPPPPHGIISGKVSPRY